MGASQPAPGTAALLPPNRRQEASGESRLASPTPARAGVAEIGVIAVVGNLFTIQKIGLTD